MPGGDGKINLNFMLNARVFKKTGWQNERNDIWRVSRETGRAEEFHINSPG
ncbi:hypothetical protein DCCM_2179 [Desulfocucumis palustris]|uniref:Uncharacterized protein n=1 Tax=Desulfocucumis palustris TaxID=1898651 RepID=A0A2L2XAJ4_9FIRM|nr:hypothetical protein DCCM_2179 [Desulfocucumis palustris]